VPKLVVLHGKPMCSPSWGAEKEKAYKCRKAFLVKESINKLLSQTLPCSKRWMLEVGSHISQQNF
jgi:hypothetical protein